MTQAFVNWARTVRRQPTAWHTPTSEAEVVAVIQRARSEGSRVKVVGSRHSWSAIAAPDVQLVDLGQLSSALSIDEAGRTITVQAGMRLQALVELLATRGLALPNVGSILEQTVAGATATGTHGSSLHTGNLSSTIVGLRLITGTGEVLDLPGDDPRLDAARVGLGALGIVTRITLAVVPAFTLREARHRMPFARAVEELVDTAQRHDFCKLWWLPHTADAMVVTHDRTDEVGARSALAWRIDGLVNQTLFPALLALGGVVPGLIPWTNRLVDRVHFTEGTRVGRSDRILTLVMPPRHREMELALPVEHTAVALHTVRRLLQELDARLDFIVEARFVRADGGWMSPAHGRDTLQLGLYGAHSPDIDLLFEAFTREAVAWEARPHWGKETRIAWPEVHALYPEAEAFVALADELDPDGVCRNAFLDRALWG